MSYLENLRAFSFSAHSFYPSPAPWPSIDNHEAIVFIPAEKNSQIVITNLMATASGTDKGYPNQGYCEIWGSYYPNEAYYSTWNRRMTAAVPAGSAVIPVNNTTNLSNSSIIALACRSDWTRQEYVPIANIIGLNLILAVPTIYAYDQGDTVIDITYQNQIPCNVYDPSQTILFAQQPVYVGMVDKEGENLYTAPKNMPLKVRMYGAKSQIVVSGYWKDMRS